MNVGSDDSTVQYSTVQYSRVHYCEKKNNFLLQELKLN